MEYIIQEKHPEIKETDPLDVIGYVWIKYPKKKFEYAL